MPLGPRESSLTQPRAAVKPFGGVERLLEDDWAGAERDVGM